MAPPASPDIGTLLEALPYIREFHGRTIVIKYGGAAMNDPALREDFARDVVLLKYVGMNPIVVHGGGPEITAYMKRLDLPVEFVGGLRVSDEATVEVAKMVLVGKVNKDIVLRINRHGQPAVGLCGDDGLLFRVDTMEGPGGEDIGYVGRIERVNAGVIEHIAEDYIPVIASIGADRAGPLPQRQRGRGGGRGGARARRLQAHVPHRRAGLAARSLRSVVGDLGVRRGRGRGGAGRHRRRDAAEAAGVPGRDPRRSELRAHRRRPRAALAAARAVHRRRPGDQDPARFMSALAPTYARFPVEFASGHGCVLVDAEGVEYLDFLAGIAVCNTGHCHPHVVAAIQEQAARLMHVSNLYWNAPMVRLAERLVERSFGSAVFFCNSGAEANEAALKLVRKARSGGEIVVFHGAFHGRTYGALSATPQESKQAPFAPLVPGFRAVEPSVEAVRAAVGEGTAAVLMEPVLGESGVHPMPDELLRAAREACDEVGAALVFDEVQTGMGRTGTLWAHEQSGVVPDAMTLAKGLGGGLPIGALVIGERLADVFAPGDHGSTFAGGPVACAAANAALDVLDDETLLARVRELGERLAEGASELPRVVAMRARGLMVAIDVEADAPDTARRALLEQRLVINATGPRTLRFLPPLVVTEAQIDDALGRLGALLA